MSPMQKRDKLKKLFQMWPVHTVLPVAWLKDQGYSWDLIRAYAKSGWITLLGKGIIARPEDAIDWEGYLWGLQRLQEVHVGGKTALEMQGKAHFLKFKETEVFLFGMPDSKLPTWIRAYQVVPFIFIKNRILPKNIGIVGFDVGEFTLKISNQARAFLEYMYYVSKHQTFEEAYYLMENLQFLSPELMQEALETCTSVKVKRLVLCLAKKQRVSWFNDLDLSKIAVGKGVMQLVKNGAYDSQFKITYPHSWDREKHEGIGF